MKLRTGGGHWTGNFQKALFRKLRLYGEMKMMLDMVTTMFMMVDEDGGYNDGGQPIFCLKK